eukprot:3021883-Amphidinium_carterae.1
MVFPKLPRSRKIPDMSIREPPAAGTDPQSPEVPRSLKKGNYTALWYESIRGGDRSTRSIGRIC